MKVRRVIDMVRGMDVNDALAMLQFAPQAASEPVYKVVASAVANAEQTDDLRRDDLFVSQTSSTRAPRWRRRPRAKGSASRILKRSSHITVVVPSRGQARRRQAKKPKKGGLSNGPEDQPERLPPRHQAPTTRRRWYADKLYSAYVGEDVKIRAC